MMYKILPFDRHYYKQLRKEHCEEFVDDLVANCGKEVELVNYRVMGNGDVAFTLYTTPTARWHNGGMWYVTDNGNLILDIVMVPPVVVPPVTLPEDLFIL